MRKLKVKGLEKTYPESIPVYAGCCEKPFMHYDVSDLFDYHGNGDGDNGLLCHIAEMIISRIESQGVSIECGCGIHNNHRIDQISWDEGVWNIEEIGIEGDIFDNEEAYVKLFNSLPDPVRLKLIELSVKGITL